MIFYCMKCWFIILAIFCQVGLVGSTFYVNSLTQEEVSKIRMNLNFDMLASPNYIYMIFDGRYKST